MASTKKISPSHTKKGQTKNNSKKLDTAIVSHSATRRNTLNTKKECQLSKIKKFKLALETQDATECIDILEKSGYGKDSISFMIGWIGGAV
ncbi:hypothetical protein BLD44_007670 [Mastigocladus laminosus UU774]|nr:hypothetical protein BLD44_007670 [Mastigocladus laminosus UU774]